MKRILVIGFSGLVASRFIELAKNNLDITGVDEKTLDITDGLSVEKYLNQHKFDAIVNFAAYTNVDKAEKERGDENGIAWKLNVVGPQNLTKICKEKDMFYVQISTDFVFTGTQEDAGPYSENHPVSGNLVPSLGWYGWTKNRAEYVVANSGVRNAIVRIAYPFYAAGFDGKLDFAKTYLKLFDEGNLYPLFTDQSMSFLNVDYLVKPLTKILTDETEGTFHLVSGNTGSPYDFVTYLLEKARMYTGVIDKSSLKEFLSAEGRTPRPLFGGLKTQITGERLKMKLPTWQQMIDDFVEKMNK